MDNILRAKMPLSQRAKIFAPFSALTGYENVLRTYEKVVVKKAELMEDYSDVLDRCIRQIETGTMIRVVYYCNDSYIKKEGLVSNLDFSRRMITVVDTEISFDDIKELHLERSYENF